jgi:pimeloyl-ACP methyl ester carboxylesterase
MYYEVHGQGAPLVLLHGFTDSSLSWQPFIGEFAKHFKIIVPDLRGHGRTLDPMNQFTLAQVALDLFALLDQLHIERFKAIGDSAGGCSLQYMATQQPARLDAIILEGCASYFPEPTRAALLADIDVALHPLRHHHVHGISQIQALVNQLPKIVDSYNAQPPELSKITAKTLVVWGDRDEDASVEMAVEMYKSIANAYLWIIPNAGHSFVFADPDRHAEGFVRGALEFFLDSW